MHILVVEGAGVHSQVAEGVRVHSQVAEGVGDHILAEEQSQSGVDLLDILEQVRKHGRKHGRWVDKELDSS